MDAAWGRQRNRRAELVISGNVIGTEIGTPVADRQSEGSAMRGPACCLLAPATNASSGLVKG